MYDIEKHEMGAKFSLHRWWDLILYPHGQIPAIDGSIAISTSEIHCQLLGAHHIVVVKILSSQEMYTEHLGPAEHEIDGAGCGHNLLVGQTA